MIKDDLKEALIFGLFMGVVVAVFAFVLFGAAVLKFEAQQHWGWFE